MSRSSHFRKTKLIRPLLEAGFFVLYYCFLLAVGSLLYVVMEGGISASSSIIALGGVGGLIECYWWTSMVDSMQETVSWVCLLQIAILFLTIICPTSRTKNLVIVILNYWLTLDVMYIIDRKFRNYETTL